MAGSVQERKRKLVLPAPPRRPSARGTQLNENAVLAQAVPHATDLAPSPRQSPGGPVSHPAHDLDWDDDLLGDNSFSAVYETLLQLRNLCALPADGPCPRFVLMHQLRSQLEDGTQCDREVHNLRLSGTVRMLHLATGDRAVVLGADWGAAVERAAAADPRARVDPARFVRRVRRACTAASVTRAELYRVLGEREGGALASSAERDGPADAAARTQPGNTGLGGDHADPGTSPRTDDGVPLSQAACRAYEDALVSWGVLQRHPTAREPCFLFGLPGGGPAVRGIIEGRKELVAVLRRRWHGEALESELGNKVRLRHSPLGLPWHVADLLGLGLAQRGSMPIGPVLRLTTRGA